MSTQLSRPGDIEQGPLARFRLHGRTAMVTGASSGFGVHFARVLSGSGARVILAARRTDRLGALQTEIEAAGGQARAEVLDVTSSQSVDDLFARLETEGWGLDILINNAGVAHPKYFTDTTEADWDYVMDPNLKGLWRVGSAAARSMIASGRKGSIVNIASVLGLGVQPMQAAYATSKAGVIQLTRSMATELFSHGIRVNALCPGYFATEMTAEYFASEGGQAYLKRIPPRRLGTLDELTGPLLLLASDAGSFITGVALPVDGGHSIRLI